MPDQQSLLSFLIGRVDWTALHLLIPLVIIQRVAELVKARRNARIVMAKGAVEAGANHYPAIVMLHLLWFVGMIVEIVVLSRAINPFWPILLVIFLLAQGLRYWAISSLGEQWNTRILVIPGSKPVSSGPYRLMKHPNYLAVVVEILILPVMLGAYITAVTTSLINLALLRVRIRAEEEAMGRGRIDD